MPTLWKAVSVLCCAFLFVATTASAQFHNNGMTATPIVKTEYVSSTTGTAANPLIQGACVFPYDTRSCGIIRTIYSQSNYYRQNWPCGTDSCAPPLQYDAYWSLYNNNEPFSDSHNSGPFDASIPRSAAGYGLMGFVTLFGNSNFAGDTKWRAHLVTNFINFANPIPHDGIPYQGFGEYTNRGNGGHPIGYLNPTTGKPSYLKWGEMLWSNPPNYPTQDPAGALPPTLATYVYMEANWGTYRKGVFITLWHWHIDNSLPPPAQCSGGIWAGLPAGCPYSHNSRTTQSALFPGAQIAYIDWEDVPTYCGFSVPSLAARVDVNYSIDMTRIFKCMSDLGQLGAETLPTTANIPITGVMWANEATGLNGSLWVDIHDQRIVTATGLDSVDTENEASGASPREYGPETQRIADALARQCDETAGCRERQQQAELFGPEALESARPNWMSREDLIRAAYISNGLPYDQR